MLPTSPTTLPRQKVITVCLCIFWFAKHGSESVRKSTVRGLYTDGLVGMQPSELLISLPQTVGYRLDPNLSWMDCMGLELHRFGDGDWRLALS